MKKQWLILGIVSVCLILGTGKAPAQEKQDGPYKEYYQNGNLRTEGAYKDGKQIGLHKWYYEDGPLAGEIIYEDGKALHDSAREYYKNGELKEGHLAEFAKTRLAVASTAAESYAANNAGAYPSDENVLLAANPPYLKESFCNKIIRGYKFICSFSRAGYEFKAIPQGTIGKKTYIRSAGKPLSELVTE